VEGFTCFYTNADSLHNKMDELKCIIIEADPDIIAITESQPKNKNEFFQPVLQGFTTFNNDSGRGVTLFIKDNINVKRREDIEKEFSPSIVCEITGHGITKSLFGVVYRTPSCDKVLNEKLCMFVDKFFETKNAFLVGDFNYPDIDWENEFTSKSTGMSLAFIETVKAKFLYQLFMEPTHHRCTQTPNVLDLFLTNNLNDIENIAYRCPIGKSHHSVISFELCIKNNIQNTTNKGDRIKKYIMDKGNYHEINLELSKINWEKEFEDQELDNCWSIFENFICCVSNKHIPTINVHPEKKNNSQKKNLPLQVLEKIKKKRITFKHYKKYQTKENLKAYAKARNQLKWELRKMKKSKEQEIANSVKENPKAFFSYVNCMTKTREKISDLVMKDQSLTSNDSEKAEILNDFFSSVFTVEDTEYMPDFKQKTEMSIEDVDFNIDDIIKRLGKLNISKAMGPDGIHPRLLKECNEVLAFPLKLLFEKCMKTGTIPKRWKIAEVKPLFKKGDKSNPGNYRPVSLTSIVCKIFEGFLRDILTKHLTENKLLHDSQFGFTAGRSCVTQILSTLQDWFMFLKEDRPVDAIYLDLQKAFDSVPHRRLIHKLRGYGVQGKLLSVIDSFLSNRTQYVKVGTHSSREVKVTSGVPQGSVLGPSLFIFYINDMPDLLDSLIKIFADDTKIYTSVENDENCLHLQTNLDRLVKWSQDWQLIFNSKKCKVLHIGKKNSQHEYIMDGNVLESIQSEKDLGVYVDSELSFEEHVHQTAKKGNRIAGMLIHYIQCKNKEIMIPLFKSLVRPILEYGNTVWHPFLVRHVKEIEDVQRRFTKKLIGVQDMDYEDRLIFLKLPSLEYRRFRGDMIEVFKILHNLYDCSARKLLPEFNMTLTRGHDLKLVKERTGDRRETNFFRNRVVNAWNKLPSSVVTAETLNMFKNRLDKHCSKFIFKTNCVLY